MNTDYIILAGGCFWGVEELFRKEFGVVDTQVGYCGGNIENPTYDDIKKGNTGYAESIKITFDTERTDLEQLLEFFFKIHDPTTLNRQGNDIGSQYRSAIFVRTPKQTQTAQKAIQKAESLGRFKKPFTTSIEPETDFANAEEEHQDYLQKHPGGYTCHFVRD